MISFEQLIGPGGKEGARTTFQRLIAQLVALSRSGAYGPAFEWIDAGLDVAYDPRCATTTASS